jgi:polysaccharide biosynthesis protein PslG
MNPRRQQIPAITRIAAIWVVRSTALYFILSWMILPEPYVEIGPQQIVQTRHPILCVHTRLTDEVDEWKIQRSLEMTREMGASTIVEFFPWAYIEADKGRYSWARSDLIVDHARTQGLEVIARLGLVPEWAQPEPDSGKDIYSLNYLTPDYYDEFAAFVEAFTRHYQGKIDRIIIWNEPNLSFEWGYQPVDPQNYVNLLKIATPAARHGNPDIIVLAGALAPTLEPVGSQFGMNDLDYLRALYQEGAAKYFDALAVHSYGLQLPPDDPPSPGVLNFRRVELIRQIMTDNGDGDKPVYITESGWNDHPRWSKAVKPGQRTLYTIDSLQYAELNWPWVKNLCIWVLRYPAPTHSYPDYYTLISPDFTPRPIYYELQQWARSRLEPQP